MKEVIFQLSQLPSYRQISNATLVKFWSRSVRSALITHARGHPYSTVYERQTCYLHTVSSRQIHTILNLLKKKTCLRNQYEKSLECLYIVHDRQVVCILKFRKFYSYIWSINGIPISRFIRNDKEKGEETFRLNSFEASAGTRIFIDKVLLVWLIEDDAYWPRTCFEPVVFVRKSHLFQVQMCNATFLEWYARAKQQNRSYVYRFYETNWFEKRDRWVRYTTQHKLAILRFVSFHV